MCKKTAITWIEKRIMKTCDGQGGIICRLIANLFSNNPYFKKFREDIDICSRTIRDTASLDEKMNGSIVNSVMQRIEEEQRVAIFLGDRKKTSKTDISIFGMESINWFSQGMVRSAAFCLFAGFLFLVGYQLGVTKSDSITEINSDSDRVASINRTRNISRIPEVANASLSTSSNSSVGTLPRVIDRGYVTPLEVDWMRSEGRVSVMHPKNSRSSIIWIRKNPVTSQLSAVRGR